jgi:hypothetical protein
VQSLRSPQHDEKEEGHYQPAASASPHDDPVYDQFLSDRYDALVAVHGVPTPASKQSGDSLADQIVGRGNSLCVCVCVLVAVCLCGLQVPSAFTMLVIGPFDSLILLGHTHTNCSTHTHTFIRCAREHLTPTLTLWLPNYHPDFPYRDVYSLRG